MIIRAVILMTILLVACSSKDWTQKVRFENPAYRNTELVFDAAMGSAKGTILLIHGTAPQNVDGEVPVPRNPLKPLRKDKTYLFQKTYRTLSRTLNDLGWNTVRYTRPGVYADHVNFSEYGKTDLKIILNQLTQILESMPAKPPKIVFAWSGGTIHALQLPLDQVQALVLLGAVSTKRTQVYRESARTLKERATVEKEINAILKKEGHVARTEMMGVDMPYGRFFDEDRLQENWKYLKNYPNLPVLILHGAVDLEVPVSQAQLWKEKLPKNNITVQIRPDANHAFSGQNERPDMEDLAHVMNDWLVRTVEKQIGAGQTESTSIDSAPAD